MHSIRSRRPTSRAFRFAPISDEPSTGLRLASGYFLLTGAFGVIGTTIALLSLGSLAGGAARRAVAAGVAINLAFCAAHVWTGLRLADRSRRGGRVAIALLATPLLNVMLGNPPSALAIAMMVVGIAIVVSVWGELR